MDDPIVREEFLKEMGSIFSSTIRLKLLDFAIELHLYKHFKFGKTGIDIRFVMK
jgi:hypothetical protein